MCSDKQIDENFKRVVRRKTFVFYLNRVPIQTNKTSFFSQFYFFVLLVTPFIFKYEQKLEFLIKNLWMSPVPT